MKPRAILIEEGKYKIVNIGSKIPYTIYSTTPLFSCFGILFKYRTGDGSKKAILYHAPSGLPTEDCLDLFAKTIREDKCLLSNVDITIAISDTLVNAKATLDSCTIDLRQARFDKPAKVVTEKACYAVDSLGAEGETITPRFDKKPDVEHQSLFDLIKKKFF